MNNDIDGSFTDMAFAQPGQNQSHGLSVTFYQHPVQNSAKTLEEGRPIFEDKDYVRIMVPGDKTTIIERPIRIGHQEKDDNNMFAREYNLYKQGKDQQVIGTPLSEWPVISRSQCKELEFFGVRTVEQLADMPDTAAQNFVGAGQLRDVAKRFISDAKDGAPLIQMQAELVSRDEKIEALEAQMGELINALEEKKKGKAKD